MPHPQGHKKKCYQSPSASFCLFHLSSLSLFLLGDRSPSFLLMPPTTGAKLSNLLGFPAPPTHPDSMFHHLHTQSALDAEPTLCGRKLKCSSCPMVSHRNGQFSVFKDYSQFLALKGFSFFIANVPISLFLFLWLFLGCEVRWNDYNVHLVYHHEIRGLLQIHTKIFMLTQLKYFFLFTGKKKSQLLITQKNENDIFIHLISQ